MQGLLFEETMERHQMKSLILSSPAVVVAYSGGADSSCLLYLMHEWCMKNSVPLHAAHVNHMIRGKEADRDEEFCRKTADELGITLHLLRENVPEYAKNHSLGLEEAAREVRYSFFSSLSESLSSGERKALIATAHNADDNAETVIFNLFRGSGTHGLAGIAPIRDGIYIRPLIGDSGKNIRQYCDSAGIKYVLDKTNLSLDYTRNKIRHTVLEPIYEIFPSPHESVTRAASLLRTDDDFITKEAEKYFSDGDTSISRELMRSLHPALSSRILRRLYDSFKRCDSTVEETHIREIISVASSEKANGRLSVPGRIDAVITRELVYFEKSLRDAEKSEPPDEFIYPQDGDKFVSGDYILLFSHSDHIHHREIRDGCEIIYNLSTRMSLCSDKIHGVLSARTRKDGDTYRYGGMTRRVKKLFSEKKLSPEERATLPIVSDSDGIVWIPGFPPRDGMIAENKENNPLILSFYIRQKQ